MVIREANTEDVKDFLTMLKKLDSETKYMLFEPDERKTSLKQMKNRIDNINGAKGLTLLIDDEGNIGGFLTAERGFAKRIEHSVYIVIGILEKYRGKKLGTELFKNLEKWALQNNIKRLELTVIESNKNAIRLYENMGFKKEGIREKSMIIDGQYVDEYYMGKIL